MYIRSFIFSWTIWKLESNNVENLIKMRNIIKLNCINFWLKFWMNCKNTFSIFFLKRKTVVFSIAAKCLYETSFSRGMKLPNSSSRHQMRLARKFSGTRNKVCLPTRQFICFAPVRIVGFAVKFLILRSHWLEHQIQLQWSGTDAVSIPSYVLNHKFGSFTLKTKVFQKLL